MKLNLLSWLRGAVLVLSVPFLAGAAPTLVSSVNPTNFTAVGGGGDSYSPIVSPDGRFILYASTANNLVPAGVSIVSNYIPARMNVYLRDRQSNSTALVSVNASGTGGGNGDSFPSALSQDGRYALFESTAFDLGPSAGASNGARQVYLRDLSAGTTTLVSAATNGVFASGDSDESTMTPDGHYAAFRSAATNLVPNDTNGISDVFVRDLHAGTTTLASVGATGVTHYTQTQLSTPYTAGSSSEYPVLSADGRYVAFYTTAIYLLPKLTNTGEIFIRDLVNNTNIWASTNAHHVLSGPACLNYALTPNGQYLAYDALGGMGLGATGPTPTGAVFRYNLASGATDIVNTNGSVGLSLDWSERAIDISTNGQVIAFVHTNALPNLGNPNVVGLVELWNSQTGSNTVVSGGATNAHCFFPRLDSTGRYVAFLSDEALTTNVDGLSHLYVRDTQSGTVQMADINDATGLPFSSLSLPFVFSGNGDVLGYVAADGNLAASAHKYDVFTRDLSANATEIVSAAVTVSATAPNESAINPACVSSNGQWIAFYSDADGLAPFDTNGCRDIYVHELVSGSNLLVSVATDGVHAGSQSSFDPAISASGRYVVFSSSATNLISYDTNGFTDIFLRDLQTGVTTLVSVDRTGTNEANGDSGSPQISDDGRFVLFNSAAKNIGSNTFSGQNAFWRDIQGGGTWQIPATNFAVMTPNGSNVLYLVGSQIWLWSAQTHGATMVDSTTAGIIASALVNADASRAVFFVWAGGVTNLYIADLAAGTNSAAVSIAPTSHGIGQFSADGRYLATLAAVNRTNQVFLYDLAAGTNFLVSQAYDASGAGDGACDSPTISPDGRFIAYRSAADDLVPNDNNGQRDLFLYDRLSGATTLVSVSDIGNWTANSFSLLPVFSGDSQTLVFESWASDLVPGDSNQSGDIFALALSSGSPIGSTNSAPPLDFSGITLSASSTGGGTNSPVLSWLVTPGASYEVQFKNSLDDAQWQNLGHVSITGSQGSAVDLAPSSAQRFYRIVAIQ